MRKHYRSQMKFRDVRVEDAKLDLDSKDDMLSLMLEQFKNKGFSGRHYLVFFPFD